MKPVVVKLGGRLLDDTSACGVLWRHIGEADRPIVVVHGGGSRVDELLTALGRPIERIDGLRVTPPEDIDLVTGVLAGTMNKLIVAQLVTVGVNAVGVSLGDAGTVVERAGDARLGNVGEVVGGDGALLKTLIEAGCVPVVSSIGIDAAGTLLNVNADDAALGVAGAIDAERVLFLSDVPGILDADGNMIHTVDGPAIELLIGEGVIAGGMAPKARSAAAAVERFGLPAVISSWREPLNLNGEGAGTTVRPASPSKV